MAFSLIKQFFIVLLSFSCLLTRVVKVSDITESLTLNEEPWLDLLLLI